MTKEQFKAYIGQQIDLMDDQEIEEFSAFLQEGSTEEHITEELVVIKGEFKKLTKLVSSMEQKLDENQKVFEENQKVLEKNALQPFITFDTFLRNAKDAIDSLPEASLFGRAKVNRSIQSLQEGFGSVSQQYEGILEAMEIQRTARVGDRFDANWHEAVEVIEDKKSKNGTIVEVLEEGFLYHNEIINYAKVKVNQWTL